ARLGFRAGQGRLAVIQPYHFGAWLRRNPFMEFPMPKVLIADKLSPAAIAVFQERGVEIDNKPGMTKEELLAVVDQYDGIAIRSATKITANVIKAAKK